MTERESSFFTEPSPDDIHDVDTNIVPHLRSVDDMRRHLGEPDETIPHPAHPIWINQFTYSRRWDSLALIVQEKRNGDLIVIAFPKPIADGK